MVAGEHHRRTITLRTLVVLLILAPAATSRAAESLHLLGFVERLCDGETHCFDLRVKAEFHAAAGAQVRVRFAGATAIFDPENYELTLAQQNIVAGSHLRLIIEPDPAKGENNYQARFIWIGD